MEMSFAAAEMRNAGSEPVQRIGCGTVSARTRNSPPVSLRYEGADTEMITERTLLSGWQEPTIYARTFSAVAIARGSPMIELTVRGDNPARKLYRQMRLPVCRHERLLKAENQN
jgi:hypothetical protein